MSQIDTSPAPLTAQPLIADCRLCQRYTKKTGGCTSTAQCVDGSQFVQTAPRQYWERRQHQPEQPLEMVASADVPLPELQRWLAVGAGGGAVRLIPVDAPSNGPDVFCKLQDAKAAVAAERERCIEIVARLYSETSAKAGRHPSDCAYAARLEVLDIAQRRLEAIRANQKGTL